MVVGAFALINVATAAMVRAPPSVSVGVPSPFVPLHPRLAHLSNAASIGENEHHQKPRLIFEVTNPLETSHTASIQVGALLEKMSECIYAPATGFLSPFILGKDNIGVTFKDFENMANSISPEFAVREHTFHYDPILSAFPDPSFITIEAPFIAGVTAIVREASGIPPFFQQTFIFSHKATNASARGPFCDLELAAAALWIHLRGADGRLRGFVQDRVHDAPPLSLCPLTNSAQTFSHAFIWLVWAGFLWAVKSASGVVSICHHFLRSKHIYLSVGLLALASLPGAHAVRCTTCSDQITGCPGGADCPFIATPVANAALLTGTAAAGAATVFTVQSILPRSYLRVLTRQVLDSLLAVIRRPLPGSAIDLSGRSLAQLVHDFKTRAAPRNDILSEITSLIPGSDRSEKEDIRLTLDSLRLFEKFDESTLSSSRGSTTGPCLALWSLAGRISQRTLSTVTLRADGEAGSSSDGSATNVQSLTEKVTRAASLEECSERITIFIALVHALGYCNVLVATNFFRETFYDPMLKDRVVWQVAHELVLIYLEDIDNSPVKNLATIFESGSCDTRLSRAKANAMEHYKISHCFRSRVGEARGEDDPNKSQKVVHNGKFTSSAPPCQNWNRGQPCTQLHANGTCKFNHVCNKWVTGKGPGGRCEGNHKWGQCDNPNKTDQRPTS